MKIQPRSVLRWLPASLWMGMIFLFSHQPGGGSGALSRLIMGYLARVGIDFQAWFGENAVWVLRKCAHFTEYMILFFLLYFALSGKQGWQQTRWRAWLLVVLYACSDEFHQLFIPGRVGDLADISIDSAGGLMGVAILTVWMLVKYRKTKVVQAPVS